MSDIDGVKGEGTAWNVHSRVMSCHVMEFFSSSFPDANLPLSSAVDNDPSRVWAVRIVQYLHLLAVKQNVVVFVLILVLALASRVK